MPLQDGIQVVLQHPRANGVMVCRGFVGLPIATSAWIRIEPLTRRDYRDGEVLAEEVIRTLKALGMNVREVLVPCGGNGNQRCHALDTDCAKVHMVLIRGNANVPAAAIQPHWINPDPEYRLIPLFLGPITPKLIPASIRPFNAVRWQPGDGHAIAEIIRAARIINNRPRVFLSYVRKESQPVAEQLFAHLHQHGFDMFLDRFCVEPGIDFQMRLTEELSRIGTVIVLETPGILSSPWVRYEIDFARMHRLGLLAVNLPGGARIRGLGSRRLGLSASDLTQRKRLRAKSLSNLVQNIKMAHANAEHRRIASLQNGVSSALARNGFVQQNFDRFGVVVARRGNRYAFRVSHLPAEIDDFHALQAYAGSHRTTVFAPGKYMDWRTRRPMEWISRISNIDLQDEADISKFIRRLP